MGEFQTCNEFGWSGICNEDSNCPFVRGYSTVEFLWSWCLDIFGISKHDVLEGTRRTNERYGNSTPQSSRVIFINGNVDPWSNVSVIVSPSPQLPTVFVPGASHHFWTHPSLPSDSVYVDEARSTIWKQ